MKKKHYLMIVFLMLPLLGHAQEKDNASTISMLEGSKSWSFSGYLRRRLECRSRDLWYHLYFSLKGEKAVDGRTYRGMDYSEVLIGSRSNREIENPKIWLREDGGRVFVNKEEYLLLLTNNTLWSWVGDASYIPYKETEDGELVLYDFTMEPGDSFQHVDGHDDIVVDSVGTLTTLDGLQRRLIYLSNGCQVAEGMGCLNSVGGLLAYLNPEKSRQDRYYLALNYVHANDESLIERTLEEVVDDMAIAPFNPKSFLAIFPIINYRVTNDELLLNESHPKSAFEDEYMVTCKYTAAFDSLRMLGYRYIEMSRYSEDVPTFKTILAREEGGRLLVKKTDYMALLAKDSYWSRVGDASYIPYRETEDGELVLYDFTMEPGDSFQHVDGHDDIGVDSVGTLTTLDGLQRRLIYLSNGCQVAEGMGCLNSAGGLLFYLNPLNSSYNKGFMSLIAPARGMVGYYQKEIYIRTPQEERDAILAGIAPIVKSEQTTVTNTPLYDLQGRRLSQKPERGVYIEGGRKVVIK